ncbi:MAG: T9SS type A sorting domain-containing protein, partial [Sphingobacteriales bacterium]
TDGGTNWTTTSSALNCSYNKLKWVNNRFFALGSDNNDYTGKIMYSTDGISWTDVTPSLDLDVYYFKDVVFDGTKYHILGVDIDGSFFTVSTSTPATAASYGNKAVCSNTPAGVTLGGTWDEGLLEYSNGKFTGAVIDIATGQDYIITSTNGSTWTALPQATFSTITGAYTNGNTLQMIGRANAFFTVSNGGILPVRLLNFNGSLYESAVQLRWSTATEDNTQQFLVQHSTDGSAWNSIGTVKAAGNSTALLNYEFTHSNPVEGTNFYRLLQQDRDGQSTYSRVLAINYGKALKAAWYPNPVTNQLIIRTASAQPGLVTLFNAGGQPVKRARISGNETQVDLTGLPAGVYVAD